MHDGNLTPTEFESVINGILGQYNDDVIRRALAIWKDSLGGKNVPPIDTEDPRAVQVDTMARQVAAMLSQLRLQLDACSNENIARELDETMLTRRGPGENFTPLSEPESTIVDRCVKSLRFSPKPRIHVTGEAANKESFVTIRRNHTNPEGLRVSPAEFRQAADKIIDHLVDSLIQEQNLKPESTVIALAWRSSLPMGAAFARRGFMRFIHLDAKRDEETLETEIGHVSAEEKAGPNDTIIMADPMLATGNTVANTFQGMNLSPSNKLISLSLISAPEGMFHLARKFPTLQLVTGALDTHLNSAGFICPGLGDFGDQYFADIYGEKAATLISDWISIGLLSHPADIQALANRMKVNDTATNRLVQKLNQQVRR